MSLELREEIYITVVKYTIYRDPPSGMTRALWVKTLVEEYTALYMDISL